MKAASTAALDTAIYANYTAWKKWQNFFEPNDLDRLRYEGDFAGLPLADRTLLEIGFGTGSLLAWAREQGADVIGCERTEDSKAAARAHGVALIEGDFTEPGALVSASLDYAIAIDVFEHLSAETIRASLFALATALRPGGMIVLRYPNGQSPFGLTAQHGDITHRVALSRMIVEQLALGSGLETVRYGSATFPRRPGLLSGAVSVARRVLRAAMIRVIQFAFATDVPLDAVVVQVLRKPLSGADDLQSR